MKDIETKLLRLRNKTAEGLPIRVAIMGLGSVGGYLFDYLLNLNDPTIEIHVTGRSLEKMGRAVNIARTAAFIRGSLASKIRIHELDLNRVDRIREFFATVRPDFVVNSSRAYSGLKYGSISWHTVRAYGIWAPLSVKYIKNIMQATRDLAEPPVVINTSYSDATNRWVGTAGSPTPDFGSGNLNHLIPRLKFAVSELEGVEDLKRIEVTLATSHFHDVLISKEGITEGVDPLLEVRVDGQRRNMDAHRLYSLCAIPMPTDQTRNMMNASSNFEIVLKILTALRKREVTTFHSPGVAGMLGGYPVQVDLTPGSSQLIALNERAFDAKSMMDVNQRSIALDGIEAVEEGVLSYTDTLIEKARKAFGCSLPKRVSLAESEAVAQMLIERVIKPHTGT